MPNSWTLPLVIGEYCRPIQNASIAQEWVETRRAVLLLQTISLLSFKQFAARWLHRRSETVNSKLKTAIAVEQTDGRTTAAGERPAYERRACLSPVWRHACFEYVNSRAPKWTSSICQLVSCMIDKLYLFLWNSSEYFRCLSVRCTSDHVHPSTTERVLWAKEVCKFVWSIIIPRILPRRWFMRFIVGIFRALMTPVSDTDSRRRRLFCYESQTCSQWIFLPIGLVHASMFFLLEERAILCM